MSCKLSDKCDNVFACNVLRPNVELLGCNFYKSKKPMTNEEYIHSLNTEQLADVLMKIFVTRTFCHLCPEGDVCDIGYKCKYSEGKKIEDWVEWLKQPHTIRS